MIRRYYLSDGPAFFFASLFILLLTGFVSTAETTATQGRIATSQSAISTRDLIDGKGSGTTNSSEVNKLRLVHFPANRSLGILEVRNIGEHKSLYDDWVFFHEARGEVMVPSNMQLKLILNRQAATDLSPLSRLKPDDLFSLDCWQVPIDDADMQYIGHLTGLKVLSLRYVPITDKGGIYLKNLKALKSLLLYKTNIQDKTLGCLGEMSSLETLILARTQITDQGLSGIAHLKSLKILDLSGTAITDSGLAHLAKLPSLIDIDLSRTDISDAGLVHLCKTVSLESIDLDTTNITDKGLACFLKMPHLKKVILQKNGIGDSGLALLAQVRSLEDLTLNNLQITDAGLAALVQLKSLKSIVLDDIKINDMGLSYLKQIKSLESISLPSGRLAGQITDEGIVHLSELSLLRNLDLGSSHITEKGITYFSNSPRLESLHIEGSGVNDAAMSCLAKIQTLKKLELVDCAFTNEGFSQIGHLVHLQDLYLNHLTQISGAGLKSLGHLTDLENLRISNIPLQDQDLDFLAKLSRLQNLAIDSNTLSNGTLGYMQNLTSLEGIDLPNSQLTDEGLSLLEKLKKLNYLCLSGDFTGKGLKSLEKLTSLQSLMISGSYIEPEILNTLQNKLPALRYLNFIENNEKLKHKPKSGEVAPSFSLVTLDNQKIKLEDYRGKVILLHFWATWCRPCVANTPSLRELYEHFKANPNFVMISLSLDEKDFLVQQHVKRYNLSWLQARIGMESEISKDYSVSGVPMYFVIGPTGNIVANDVKDYSEIKTTINDLLNSLPTAKKSP